MILGNPRSREIEHRGWKTLVGGSPLTKTLCKEAWDKGIIVCTGYGMSETNGTLCRTNLKPSLFGLNDDEKFDIYCKTGFPIPNNADQISAPSLSIHLGAN
jgi:fatty-acyl-CoA synthase